MSNFSEIHLICQKAEKIYEYKTFDKRMRVFVFFLSEFYSD